MPEKLIKGKSFYIVGQKTTICLLTLNNDFEVVGSSACVDANDFNKEEGERWAYKSALSKLEELEGFMRQEQSKQG